MGAVGSRALRAMVAAWAALVLTVAVAGPVDAQEDPASDEFSGDESEESIRTIRWSLIAIAAGTASMLVVYVWHTSPRRRARIAQMRAVAGDADVADRAGRSANEFLLPGDVASGERSKH